MGRRAERSALDALVAAVRTGESQVLVVHGEPGVGKTALLEYVAGHAAGCRVLRVSCAQWEMELAFAGLHQLCAPLLDRLGMLPGPRREALATAFGMSAGPAPDLFLVGLAVLGLLSEVTAERPVVCVVDDAQWLDRASTQVLAFVARRLGAESVGLIFGARVPANELGGLPELAVEGLAQPDARALLESVLAGPVDARVREQIIADARGNPLALLELRRGLGPAELAGGFGLAGALPLAGRIEDSFRRQIDALPAQARRLLVVAAADPTGDPALVNRAAGLLSIGPDAASPVAEAGLAEFTGRVRFRHPLVRSAAYQTGPDLDRQEAHRVLAEATDAAADPDRRAWHRAQAAAGPDEEVAIELERSAVRARARGGLAAAAAFAERAAALTADPERRTGRVLAAAQVILQAGGFGKALELLTAAEAGSLDELQSAKVDDLRGQVAFASSQGSDAAPLLLKAAKRFEALDAGLAREAYLDAYQAAQIAGHLAGGGDLDEVSRAARPLLSAKRPPQLVDLLLDGLTLLVTEGPAAAASLLRQAISALADPDVSVKDQLRWSWMAPMAGDALWDYRGFSVVERPVRLARQVGALDRLPMLLNQAATAAVWRGDFAAAASLIAEADAVSEVTGARMPPYAAMRLAAFRGREAEAGPLIRAAIEQAAEGQGVALTGAHWMAAALYNGLGRYAEALASATQASEQGPEHYAIRALPELVEAATRTGNRGLAEDALGRLEEWTQAGGTDWGLGIVARSRALLIQGQGAEPSHREAIWRLGRTRLRPALARACLLYGEWLRRENRPSEAREQLRAAAEMFDDMGMEAFGDRARRELRSAGGTARRRAVTTAVNLTARETQIARLAGEGLSNPEIASRLFLSPRTVQYHLGKVFTKLRITSRAQLGRAAPSR
jgi:DNA-binding CsgD family transcriptional regulator